MEVKVNDVVMPGDIVKDIKNDAKEKIILGPGLRREADTVYICKAGTLKKRAPAIYYVDNYQKRYIPNRREIVIGIVTQKVGDIFKVDIGSKESASLSYLAFEGATKKNRPDIQIGDAVFAKLLVAIKDMEPELVCVDSEGKEKKLGVLSSDGMLFNCSLNLVRKLLNPDCMLLKFLGKSQPYEVAIGMNGRIWVKTKSVHQTIAIANAILVAEYTPINKMQQLCNSIEKTLLT
ncbi:exosome complex component RRP40 [Polistes fuscatus]|uniref:exosome complex component RRP40 n=1 Tax=Polistes fuscatus TaxID=30207 RepID=UPI001CA8A60A|nr:exosome complex component RRP40 [Polistes fuscatus]XP_043504991.1 exosome complex component RRP40 [Polistes fuscatus]XP_043504992.1 exosome complex component RRP40 [Polistes fuscatus]XP_043504993.1 exosome complex component RRP40 [Polistes fuscatus]XP_043504994.1 exosome complex component RRP40 [Polistes fuscatus]